MARLQDDAIRGNIEWLGVDRLKRTDDGGHQVGATANGFGDDDLRQLALAQFFHRARQLVKITTKARASNLANVEALRTQKVRID